MDRNKTVSKKKKINREGRGNLIKKCSKDRRKSKQAWRKRQRRKENNAKCKKTKLNYPSYWKELTRATWDKSGWKNSRKQTKKEAWGTVTPASFNTVHGTGVPTVICSAVALWSLIWMMAGFRSDLSAAGTSNEEKWVGEGFHRKVHCKAENWTSV